MLPKLSPHKGEPQYNMDLGQNDSVNEKAKNLTLTIARNSRRKSIEDNLMMPNVRFGKQVSRTDLDKGAGKGVKTQRNNDNETFNSRLQTEDNSNLQESFNEIPNKRMSVYSSNRLSFQANNSGNLHSNAALNAIAGHNRYNRSFDEKYSPNRKIEYKKWVGDISKFTLPSKFDEKPSHSALEKTAINKRYLKKQKEKQENEEIAQGNVEIVVYNIQSHIKLILRLIKAAYQSLEEYK